MSVISKKQFRIYYLTRKLFDKIRGVKFLTYVDNETAGTDGAVSYWCSPTYAPVIKKILKRYNVGANDVFCDYGCGTGNILRVAKSFPFKTIKGVEISEYVYNIAKKNVEKMKWNNVEVVNENALYYNDIDDVTFFFFYNPFPESVFIEVVNNITNSIKRVEREIVLIYHNPSCKEIIEKSELFSMIERIEGNDFHLEIRIYKHFTN